MGRVHFRSSVTLLSVFLLGSMMGGCSDGNGGGGSGGRGGSGSGGTSAKGGAGGGAGGLTGTGGSAKGGSGGGAGGAGGGAGGTAQDAGRDAAGGAGGKPGDGGPDVPITGGAGGGIDGGIDGAPSTGGVDGGGIDGAIATTLHVYVGCADTTGTMQLYTMNSSTAALTPVATFVAGGAISNAELSDTGDRFYVIHTINGESKASTYARDAKAGGLTLMGSPVAVPYNPPGTVGLDGGVDGGAASTNAGPQTLTFDRTRKFLAVPNYYSGYVYVYGVGSDGAIGPLVSWHSAGKNAHHAVFTLNDGFMLVPYLGSNLIQSYGFNVDTGAITAGKSTTLPNADSGPRHLALHANGNWLYAINETAGGASSTAGTIDFFKVDQTAGTVTSAATYQVPLPTGYSGAKNGGEIEISPSGNLLYVSMRLDGTAQGSVVSYRIGADTGALTLIEQESTHGTTPRQFSLSKDGTLLLVGNQNSNTMAVFRTDPATGDMTFVSTRDVCASPRFVKMAAAK
jgi:6-phosphogluconolactonase (cycloisomerase 2 family)